MHNMLYRSILIMLVLYCPAIGAHGQSYSWSSLTTDDAVQAVKQFEGNPPLNVTVAEAPPDNGGVPRPEIAYKLTAGNYGYYVSKYTKDFFYRRDNTFSPISSADNSSFYGQPYDPNVLASQAMSQSSAQAIARTFLEAHYPNPDLLNAVEVIPHLGDKNADTDIDFVETYEFLFYNDLGQATRGPSNCSVEVDAIKGQIVCYASSYYPLLISTTPSLTSDQATAIAMNSLQVSNGVPGGCAGLMVSTPDAMGGETLVYNIGFYGRCPGFVDDDNYAAIVDANTGSVLMVSPLHVGTKPKHPASRSFVRLRRKLAAQPFADARALEFTWNGRHTKLTHPPLLISGCPYLYAGYLGGGYLESKSKGPGRQWISSSFRHKRYQNLNSRVSQKDQQPIKAAAKPVLLNGQCYVPLDVAQAVLPGKFKYDARARTLRFDPPRLKQARK